MLIELSLKATRLCTGLILHQVQLANNGRCAPVFASLALLELFPTETQNAIVQVVSTLLVGLTYVLGARLGHGLQRVLPFARLAQLAPTLTSSVPLPFPHVRIVRPIIFLETVQLRASFAIVLQVTIGAQLVGVRLREFAVRVWNPTNCIKHWPTRILAKLALAQQGPTSAKPAVVLPLVCVAHVHQGSIHCLPTPLRALPVSLTAQQVTTGRRSVVEPQLAVAKRALTERIQSTLIRQFARPVLAPKVLISNLLVEVLLLDPAKRVPRENTTDFSIKIAVWIVSARQEIFG